LIGCELLSDVHKICLVPGDEDLSVLRRHLLQGRGWRSLAALQYLGVQVMFLHNSEAIIHLEVNVVITSYSVLQIIFFFKEIKIRSDKIIKLLWLNFICVFS
jgi:hypothetical protein